MIQYFVRHNLFYLFLSRLLTMVKYSHVCPTCMVSFTRPSNLRRHVEMRRCALTDDNTMFDDEHIQSSSSSSNSNNHLSSDNDNECDSSYEKDGYVHSSGDSRSSTTPSSEDDASMFSCEYASLGSSSNHSSHGSFNPDIEGTDESSCDTSLATNMYDSEDFDLSDEENTTDSELPPPPIHIVEARLLELMMQYSVPLGSYKSFLEWGKLCGSTNYDFESAKKTFGTNMKKLMKDGSQARNQVSSTNLPGLGGLPDASVFTFPFLKNAKHMFAQEKLMQNSLWTHDASATDYGESNTGLWWKIAEENMKRRLDEFDVPDKHLHYIAPVTMFIDNTHCDRNGRLQAEPCLVSFGNICLEQRKKASAYFLLGLLPSKLLSSAERDKLKNGKGCRSDYLQMYHDGLRIILNELHELQINDRADGCGVSMFVHGKGEVFLHFEINLIIGDTSGHDILTGHNQCYSKKTPHPIRSCTISWDDLDNHTSQCEFVNPKQTYDLVQRCMDKILRRRKVVKYRDMAKGISHQLVIPALYELGFGGFPRGLFCATPFEILHTHMLGTMKYTLDTLFNYKLVTETTQTTNGSTTTTTKTSKPLMVDEIERRIRILSMHSKRQSDRDMPRAVFNKGVTTLGGIQGQEYVGLSILTIAALPGMLKDISEERLFMKLLWKGISLCFILCRDQVPKEEIESSRLMAKIRNYNDLFVQVCENQRYYESPNVVCKIPKLHGLLHFPSQIQDHGSAENFNGSYLESMLKDFIKRPGKRTRRTHTDFALDLMNRWSEFSSISDYMSTVDKSDLDDAILPQMNNNSQPIPRVPIFGDNADNTVVDEPDRRYKMIRNAFSFQKLGNTWHTVCGTSMTMDVIHPDCQLLPTQLLALKSFLTTDMDQLNVKHVDCFYEMRLKDENSNQIFRCNPSYRKQPWFDFIYVDYMNASNVVSSCASLLLLWLTFEHPVSKETQLYALTHSLTSQNTPRWTFMPAWKGDRLYEGAKVVNYETSISGVAYVLPGVDPFLVDPNERCTKGRLILQNVLDNKYFLVIPQRHDWAKIGWDDMTF